MRWDFDDDAAVPTREDVLTVAGNLCNLNDTAGRVIWPPSLPGAAVAGCFEEWMQAQAAAGATHTFIGPFEPGPAYPGAAFDNPDLTAPADLRAFVLKILQTRSASGKGFVPVLFLDGGGKDPAARWDRWQAWGKALEDVQGALGVCPAWEPVVGDWTSREMSDGLGKARAAFPGSALIWHGSPTRWAGSSNPVEHNDPWQGGESEFYKTHNGQFIDLAFYQTPHGPELYRPCTCVNAAQKFGHDDACWLNRWEDGVARLAAGINGWRVLRVVLYETVAFEFFRGQATLADARRIAALAKGVADKWGVAVGYGNGLPH